MAFTFSGIRKSYRTPGGQIINVLDTIDLKVEKGQFLCLLGPTGCGKTTLLRILSGLEKADSGSLDLGDSRLGYVFQQGALFPWLSVESNVMFPLRARGMSKKEASERCRKMLGMVGLLEFAGSFPHELSGGMQQRTALARGLVTEPHILLLDEPFASLDERTAMILQDTVRELCKKLSTTVVFVTHNIDEAVYLADRIVVMGQRPGFIARDETVNLSWPRNRLSNPFTELLLSIRRTFEELVDPCLSSLSQVKEQE